MKESVDIYKLLRKHKFGGDCTRGLETETSKGASEMQGYFISLLQQEPFACFSASSPCCHRNWNVNIQGKTRI